MKCQCGSMVFLTQQEWSWYIHRISDTITMVSVQCVSVVLTIVYSTLYSGADQRKHQSSVSLAFVRGIPWWPVNSPHKWPVTRKMFPFDVVIIKISKNFMLFKIWMGLVGQIFIKLRTCSIWGFLRLPVWCPPGSNMLWLLKRAPHLNSLVWFCVVCRSKSSLELAALCIFEKILIYVSVDSYDDVIVTTIWRAQDVLQGQYYLLTLPRLRAGTWSWNHLIMDCMHISGLTRDN